MAQEKHPLSISTKKAASSNDETAFSIKSLAVEI
jgi:hypothetical protein